MIGVNPMGIRQRPSPSTSMRWANVTVEPPVALATWLAAPGLNGHSGVTSGRSSTASIHVVKPYSVGGGFLPSAHTSTGWLITAELLRDRASEKPSVADAVGAATASRRSAGRRAFTGRDPALARDPSHRENPCTRSLHPMPATIAPTLVEREREISALAAALDDAAAGHGRTVAVVGEPGIGKSRLLAAAREHGRAAGMLVCSARGAELEREFPFGAVRQLAASSFADTTREERAAWFAGVARMAAPLFREEAIAEGSEGASYARLHALYWLCANAARRGPLVLVVDDAHWADDASLAFAGFLARRVGELPLALLLGSRPPGPGEAAELARVLADPETAVLAPSA